MKIVNNKKKEVRFDSLNPGDVFQNDDVYFMKTERVADECRYVKNAVNIEEGYFTKFDESDFVTAVDCELVIK